nr:hypothetical protein [Candidatus Njordarchaeota archaeon]
MYSRYILEDGREIKTPWLDGVLERAFKLVDEWVYKKPLLETVPYHLLLLEAIGCTDTERVLKALEKRGVLRKEALHKAHSHLPEILMLAGLTSFLSGNTWCLLSASKDPTAPPTSFSFKKDSPEDTAEPLRRRLTEQELREVKEFKIDLPELFGKEATEHLLRAIFAYDMWARKSFATKGETSCRKHKK